MQMLIAVQARKAAQLEESRPADDPDSDAQRQKMADEEQRNIDRVADEMGLKVHQVCIHLLLLFF
jgi:hypothetical protein